MAYSPMPSSALQGHLASPITWRSPDQQARTGLAAPSRRAPIRAAPQQMGSFRIASPPTPSSGLAGANLQPPVRSPPGGAFSTANSPASPQVNSQSRLIAPLVSSPPRPILSAIPETYAASLRVPYSESSSSVGLANGLANARYAKPLESTHRDNVTRISQRASPIAPVRSLGNSRVEATPSSPPVIRHAASPSTPAFQTSSFGSKVPPRIVSSFQAGAEASTPQVGLGGMTPQIRSVPSQSRMNYLNGSARAPANPSSPTVSAFTQGTKFRWDGPEVKVGASQAKVISGGLARRACESPLRSQQGWSPSTFDARSMPTASPSPSRTGIQSLVPPLSHRTTSPLPAKVLTVENQMVDVRTDMQVDGNNLARSQDSPHKTSLPAEVAGAMCTPTYLVEKPSDVILVQDMDLVGLQDSPKKSRLPAEVAAATFTQAYAVEEPSAAVLVQGKDLVGLQDVPTQGSLPAEVAGEMFTQTYVAEEQSDAIFVQAINQVQPSLPNTEIPEAEVMQTNNGIADGVLLGRGGQTEEFVQNVEEYVETYEVQPQSAEYTLDEDVVIPTPDVGQDAEYQQGSDFSWAIAADKHPLVSDEEATYVFECLHDVRERVGSTSFAGVAVDEGLCNWDARHSMDPHDVVRKALERILQNYSRNGASDTFVMPGTVYSTGYKKKLPLHVFPGDGVLPFSEAELLAKPATMTVIWPWDVKLELDAQYS